MKYRFKFLSNIQSQQFMMTLYFALVESHIIYIEIWLGENSVKSLSEQSNENPEATF